MDDDQMIESPPFDPAPRTQAEMLRAIYARLGVVEQQVRTTNGRVTQLERAAWGLAGGMIVVTVIVVPLFLGVIGG
jgi:hypothetical protein